ncbi:MAG: alpha/beta hydrolase [Verrucomicrobia bacterium]|nr:alpha/beta hydrolase [Verrucomicrobiota bacterium]
MKLNPIMILRCLLLLLFFSLTGFAQSVPKEDKSYRIIRDLEYSKPEGLPQLLDLYLPKEMSDGPLPVVVWVHGGGWLNGKKEIPKAEYLAGHGYAVASINYRLTHEAIWPAQIEDCRESVRWLRRHAKSYHLDSKNIGVWGSSAGGHLVALMGTLPYPKDENISSRVKAVCDWFGPTELLSMPPNNVGNGRTEEDVANSNGAKLLGCTVKDCPELARQASALDNVSSDDASFLIMQGELDPGVPVSQSSRFYDKLKVHGVYAEFEIVKEGGHGGRHFNTDAVRSRVLRFFDSNLK